MKRFASIITTLGIALIVSACATPGAQPGAIEIQRGVIEQITPAQIATNHHQGLGAVVGGLGGLGIGSLIGAGTGRDVAMVVGAIGGAVIGNEVQKKHDQPIAGQQIIVRLSSGVLVQITQPVGPSLRVGQRVYIEGSGENARVVPQ
ncbi:MAG: glycine zipper 2TM domain-containing protein [Betaproteobacteria bacterium]